MAYPVDLGNPGVPNQPDKPNPPRYSPDRASEDASPYQFPPVSLRQPLTIIVNGNPRETGSVAYFGVVSVVGQVVSRTRLRSRGSPARPYIWRLSILRRLTLPSALPEFQGRVRPLRTASGSSLRP